MNKFLTIVLFLLATGQIAVAQGPSNPGGGGSGSGDVAGPSSSTTDHLPAFSSGTGKAIKDSGVPIGTTGAAIGRLDTSNTWGPGVQTLPQGTDATCGGQNSAGNLICSLFPDGDSSGVPGTRFGTALGFVGPNQYYGGSHIVWWNNAQSNVKYDALGGALMNVISGQPGLVGNVGGQYRWQIVDNSGDLSTTTKATERTLSATSYMFDVSTTSGNNVATITGYDPTASGYLAPVVAYTNGAGGGKLLVRMHSAAGLTTTAKVTALTSTTITLDEAASGGTGSTQNFSMAVLAPAANYSFGVDYLMYVYLPFTGTMANTGAGGVAEITNLSFDPTKIGTPPSSIMSGGTIPLSTRAIDYSVIGGVNSLTAGDATTGQALSPGTCTAETTTITVNTGNEIYSGTGDISTSCNVTNLTVSPLARSIPTTGGAAWDRSQTGGGKRFFLSGSAVTGVSSGSVTFANNALITDTGMLKVNMRREALEFSTMVNGLADRYARFGWDELLNVDLIRFDRNLYLGSHLVGNATSGELVGVINSASATITTASITTANLTKPALPYTAPTIAATAITLDMDNGPIFNVALNSDVTVTISNQAASKYSWLCVNWTADGTPRVITYPASFKWGAAGGPPTPTTTNGKIDQVCANTPDGGTSWLATVTQQAY